MSADLAPVPFDEPDLPTVPVFESDPDEAEVAPFQVAYRKNGERVVEDFEARRHPPFAIFRRFGDLELASIATRTPTAINEALRRLFTIALTDESATRLLALIEGDEDEVGVITSTAINGIVRFLKDLHYESPTPPGSSNGGQPTRSGSSAGRSGKKSTSKPSPRKKA